MNIVPPDQKLEDIKFEDSAFEEWLERIDKDQESNRYHLSLLIGRYEPNKRRALKEIEQRTGTPILSLNFNDIVSKDESETIEHIDSLFTRNVLSESILYLENGDKLCGAYTGFTHSKVKYATPQERHFISRAQNHSGVIMINIHEKDSADLTLRRASHSIVHFNLPDSPIKRFLWHLRNYSFHGYDIKSKRPEDYNEFSEHNYI